jgi:hypothetical protein
MTTNTYFVSSNYIVDGNNHVVHWMVGSKFPRWKRSNVWVTNRYIVNIVCRSNKILVVVEANLYSIGNKFCLQGSKRLCIETNFTTVIITILKSRIIRLTEANLENFVIRGMDGKYSCEAYNACCEAHKY